MDFLRRIFASALFVFSLCAVEAAEATSVPHVGDVIAAQYGIASYSGALTYVSDLNVLIVASGRIVYNARTGQPTAVHLPSNDPSAAIAAMAYDHRHRTLYFAGGSTLYAVGQSGIVKTAAGGFAYVLGLAVDPGGTVYVIDNDHISKVVHGVVHIFTAPGTVTNPSGETSAVPHAAFDTHDGALYYTDPSLLELKRVSASGAVAVVAGSCALYSAGGPTTCFPGDSGGYGSGVRFGSIGGIAYDAQHDRFFISDASNNQLWTVTPAGRAVIVAGFGTGGLVNGSGRYAFLQDPTDVAYDPGNGTVYFGQATGYQLVNGSYVTYVIGSLATVGSEPNPPPFPYQTFVPPSRISEPGNVAVAPDGTAWFAETTAAAVGHVTTSGIIERHLVRSWVYPSAIVIDDHCTPWVSAQEIPEFPSAAGLLRLNHDGSQSDFPVPSTSSFQIPSVNGITVGPHGNIWYSEHDFAGSSLGYVDPATARLTRFPIATSFNPPAPGAIILGPDENLWYATYVREDPQVSEIAEMSPNGTLLSRTIPTTLTPFALARNARDGAIWYIDGYNVGRISSAGAASIIRACPFTTCNPTLLAIAAAPDGSMWVTDQNDQIVVRIDPSYRLTAYILPNAAPGVTGIAVRPDGKVFITAIFGAVYLLDPVAYARSPLQGEAGHFASVLSQRRFVRK